MSRVYRTNGAKVDTDLHLGLELALQYPVEFLDIVRDKRVNGRPTESLRQFGCV